LISDLVSGHIPMIAQSVTGHMMELHETGKVRMLCVTSPKRLAAFPTLPTAVEAGLPNMVAQNFIGLFAPAKTPMEIIEQISRATRAALADPQFQQAFVAAGFDPFPDSTPAGTRRFVEDEITRWTPVIKSIGLKLE
jgi:tripartite-type tricarboxylate transporter receptor subunit TctC